jgi:hypothetical protein
MLQAHFFVQKFHMSRCSFLIKIEIARPLEKKTICAEASPVEVWHKKLIKRIGVKSEQVSGYLVARERGFILNYSRLICGFTPARAHSRDESISNIWLHGGAQEALLPRREHLARRRS